MKWKSIWYGLLCCLTVVCLTQEAFPLSAIAETGDNIPAETMLTEVAGSEAETQTEPEMMTEAIETTECTTETQLEGPDEETISLGDLTGDGVIGVEDAVLVLTIYAKMAAGVEVNLSPQQFFCADCDHSFKIDVSDAVLILEYYAKCAANLVHVSFSDYVDQEQQTTETTTVPATSELTTESIMQTQTETNTMTIVSTTTPAIESSAVLTETIIPETTTAPVSTESMTTSENITTLETTPTTSTTTTADIATTSIGTTTTTLPDAMQLSVNCILQNESPSLPTGCEATALTIALQYDGFSADKTEIAKTYLPKMIFYTLNSVYYGADFQYVFPGDPTTSYGYGCYAPAITATANAYFTAQKNASYAENISGTSFENLLSYVASGRPVVFWATINMREPTTGGSWSTPDGNTVTWISHEHCLVLTGYDKNAGTVQVADPLKGTVSYDLSLVAQRYEQMGKQAVILHSTADAKTETEGVISDQVYRLRNVGSGLYLTVADGTDADQTNLIQDTANETTSQEFRISYDAEINAYRLYAMCSSDGTNRVVDIVKLGGGICSGCNVEIYRPVDTPAQTFVLIPQEDGSMLLSCNSNRSTCLSVWNDACGSNTGTGFYADGNVVIRNDIGEDYQHWVLESVS